MSYIHKQCYKYNQENNQDLKKIDITEAHSSFPADAIIKVNFLRYMYVKPNTIFTFFSKWYSMCPL